MALDQISGYLSKYKRITPPDEHIRKMTAEIIERECGFDVRPQSIRVHGNTIFIKAEPLLRTEIFLKKEKILEKLNELHRESRIKYIQ